MILKVTIIGLLAGVIGTGLGGVISAIFKREVDKYLSFYGIIWWNNVGCSGV